MSRTQVTMGELEAVARQRRVDPDQSYEELREEIDVHECKHCQDEYLHDTWDGFCSDTCQVEYIHEHHR